MSEVPEDDDWIDKCVTRAAREKAVGVYLSANRLLAQLPMDIRAAVRPELEAFGTTPEFWCLAAVPLQAPVGAWLVYQRPDRIDVVWVLLVVSSEEYAKRPKQIEDGLQAQLVRSPWN